MGPQIKLHFPLRAFIIIFISGNKQVVWVSTSQNLPLSWTYCPEPMSSYVAKNWNLNKKRMDEDELEQQWIEVLSLEEGKMEKMFWISNHWYRFEIDRVWPVEDSSHLVHNKVYNWLIKSIRKLIIVEVPRDKLNRKRKSN